MGQGSSKPKPAAPGVALNMPNNKPKIVSRTNSARKKNNGAPNRLNSPQSNGITCKRLSCCDNLNKQNLTNLSIIRNALATAKEDITNWINGLTTPKLEPTWGVLMREPEAILRERARYFIGQISPTPRTPKSEVYINKRSGFDRVANNNGKVANSNNGNVAKVAKNNQTGKQQLVISHGGFLLTLIKLMTGRQVPKLADACLLVLLKAPGDAIWRIYQVDGFKSFRETAPKAVAQVSLKQIQGKFGLDKIFLVRHGCSVNNIISGKCTETKMVKSMERQCPAQKWLVDGEEPVGVFFRKDPLLAHKGKADAFMLGKQLSYFGENFLQNTKIYCSPMRRTIETLSCLLRGYNGPIKSLTFEPMIQERVKSTSDRMFSDHKARLDMICPGVQRQNGRPNNPSRPNGPNRQNTDRGHQNGLKNSGKDRNQGRQNGTNQPVTAKNLNALEGTYNRITY